MFLPWLAGESIYYGMVFTGNGAKSLCPVKSMLLSYVASTTVPG